MNVAAAFVVRLQGRHRPAYAFPKRAAFDCIAFGILVVAAIGLFSAAAAPAYPLTGPVLCADGLDHCGRLHTDRMVRMAAASSRLACRQYRLKDTRHLLHEWRAVDFRDPFEDLNVL
jgi:hypothetical protein